MTKEMEEEQKKLLEEQKIEALAKAKVSLPQSSQPNIRLGKESQNH
jgi:hypothetical protein